MLVLIMWGIWGARNKVSYEGIDVSSSSVVSCNLGLWDFVVNGLMEAVRAVLERPLLMSVASKPPPVG